MSTNKVVYLTGYGEFLLEGLYLVSDQLAATSDLMHWSPLAVNTKALEPRSQSSSLFLFLFRREFDPPTGCHRSTQSMAAPQVPGL